MTINASDKILIVDDSLVTRKTLVSILNKLGFNNIQEAENGKIALEYSQNYMPNLVIVDWNMPEMSGMDYVKAIKNMNQYNKDEMNIIVCTTENDMDNIKNALDYGVDEYIMKPFNREILESKLLALGVIDHEDI